MASYPQTQFRAIEKWVHPEPDPFRKVLRARRASLPRIVSYNVHRCLGTDGRLSPERIAQVIAECEPDIVALQELDVGRQRTGGHDQAELIARALNMEMHFHPAMQVMEELFGDAILTAAPSRLVRTGALPGSSRIFSPRGALWATVQVGGMDLQVINTHLGLRARERLSQMETLLGPDWVGAAETQGPVLLAGDFNAGPRSPIYNMARTQLRNPGSGARAHRAPATFPARRPVLRIDHIFPGKGVEITALRTLRGPTARLASDHLPLVADFRKEED